MPPLADLPPWALLPVAAAAALIAHAAFFLVAGALAKRTEGVVDDALVRRTRLPVAVILPVAAMQMVAPSRALDPALLDLIRHALALVQIAAVSWLLVRLFAVVDDVIDHHYRVDVRDNLAARRIHTQMRILRRTAAALITVLAVAAMLMTFPRVRQFGTSLLTSAGIAGLVLGMAARPVLANLIAGIQIAMAQPIRLDDVVIVEGEWGRVEEITATYVVVRIWDERRLVVPLSHFTEHPFQNWTRTRADILATVFLHVDYTVPVDEVRAEFKRVLDGCEHWDGRAWALQVTDATERTMQLRALASAADSPSAWELRVHVRERLIAWLQERHPDGLPQTRAVVRRP